MTVFCKCGCKKTDHEYAYDYGQNGGECLNCGSLVCSIFVRVIN